MICKENLELQKHFCYQPGGPPQQYMEETEKLNFE